MSASEDIDALMVAAKRRVQTVIGIVWTFAAWITLNIPISKQMPRHLILPTVYWFFGCIVLVVLGTYWYRRRVAAAERLLEILRVGSPKITNIDAASFKFEHVIPIGYEVAIEFENGELLSFGFWTKESCRVLEQAVSELKRA